MSAEEFAGWAGGILAVLGILSVLIRVAVKLDRVENLARELAPNGGGSIKDAVHRIETKVDDNTELIGDHAVRLARAEGRVEAIALVTSPTMLIEDDEGVIREAKARRD